jgi:HEAT repeat protein
MAVAVSIAAIAFLGTTSDGRSSPGSEGRRQGVAPKTTPAPVGQPVPDPVLVAKVDRLAHIWQPADTAEAVADLARHGAAAVDEIGRQLANRPFDTLRVHTSVRVLQAVNDERSRTLLRQLSFGQMTGGKPDLDHWAAQALVACDPAEAWKLLSAPVQNVRATALNAIKGQPFDADRVALLVACLKDPERVIRGLAAWTLADGADNKLAPEAARAIVAALAAVADLPDAKGTEPIGGTYPPTIALTPSERCYADYMRAVRVLRLDNKSLEETTKTLTGRARDSVTIVRGRRGDPTARPDLIKLCQDSQAGMFRAWAVQAMHEVGTPEDLPMLKKLAETDPLVREGPVAPVHVTGPMYVVRHYAKEVIAAIERKE